MRVNELAAVVDELIEILHLQAQEIEKLIAHVGQVTVHLPEESTMSVIRSSLGGLRLRVKQLREAARAPRAKKGTKASPANEAGTTARTPPG